MDGRKSWGIPKAEALPPETVELPPTSVSLAPLLAPLSISRLKEELGHFRSTDARQKFYIPPYPRTTPNLSRYGHKKPF